MPVGILTDVAATFGGGILGCLLGTRLSERWKALLKNILGIEALVMGIVLIIRVHTLPAAILSLLLGALLGEGLRLEERVNQGAMRLTRILTRDAAADAAYLGTVSAALVLFCFGGTGWYGALNEGLTGDGSILLAKAILDCVTACIFAALLGKIIPTLCLPQLFVYLTLFGVSKLVAGWITPEMIADFSAVGGMITLIAGLRLSQIKTDIPVLNCLPGLILAFFVSGLWTALL